LANAAARAKSHQKNKTGEIMKRAKITIIGAGHVGETCAQYAASRALGDIVLVDIIEGMPKGKALDLCQAAPIEGYDVHLTGTNSYEETADSDVIIITSGIPRGPGMSRDELIETNVKVVADVTAKVVEHSPEAILLVVTNPLDAMVYTAWKISGFPTHRVVGQAGILDIARFSAFIAMEIGCSVKDVRALLMGGEIVGLLKTGSAYYAPSTATISMAQSILHDERRILPCAAYCDKEYKVGGYFVGVPCVLGKNGVEKVIEVELDEKEREMFNHSVEHVKKLSATAEKLLAK